MTIIAMPVILPHVVSEVFLELCSHITKFCRILQMVIVITIVIFFKLRVVVIRGKVKGVMNPNEVVQDSKC